MANQPKRTIRLVAPDGVGPFLVNRFTGTEALSRLFEYKVDLLSEDGEVAFADLMGQPVALVMAAKVDDAERVISGFVSALSLGEKLGRFTQYGITMVPYLWFADRVAECRVMPANMTVPDIVKSVLMLRGFNDIDDSRLIGHYVPRPYCVQYRETDFNFVSRLLEEEGIYYYFEHKREGGPSDDKFKHTLVLCDAPTAHQTGKNCASLHVADADSREVETIRGWHASSQAHPHQAHLTDFSYEIRQPLSAGGQVAFDTLSSGTKEVAFSPPVSEDVVTESGDRHKVGALVADYPAGFHAKHQKTDRDRLASIRAEESSARRLVDHGVTAVHGLVPGTTFKLDTKPPGEYLVIAAHTKGWSDVGESGVAPPPGEPYECRFDAIDLKRQYRPARTTPKPRIVGPQTALVVGDKAKNAFTDVFGNVRVKFPWDVTKSDDETCSCLVRVAEPWAGNGWGVMFMPRVGHEVIVEFLEGDPDRPLITGRLYNGQAKPPYDPRQHASVSTIKSMTTDSGKGYNELRFEDKKDSEQVFINAQRQMDLRTGANLYETIGGNREVRIGADDQGNYNRLVSGARNLHVKGGVFEEIEKKRHTHVKQEVVQVYDDNHTVTVTGRQNLSAKDIVVEAKQTASLKSDQVVLQGGSALSIKADNIKIEGTQILSLKAGSSMLVLTPSAAFLAGPMAFVNSGGAPMPADPATPAQSPTIQAPVDAAEATSDLPGEQVAAGGPAPERTRDSQKVRMLRAPEPHPPPPAAPGAPAAPSEDRQLLDIAWVETETVCGGPATLKGKTKGYSEGDTEDADVRNVSDGATVVGVPLAIHGNAFRQALEVKDWMPRKAGAGYEESRDMDAYAAGHKTPKSLTMRFFPTLRLAECALTGRTRLPAKFSMEVKDYVCHVFENITYVPGRLGHLIKLGSLAPKGRHNPAARFNAGPGDDNVISGKGWWFGRRHPQELKNADGSTIKQYWDGGDWVDAPPDWKDEPKGTKLIGIGLWRDGSKNRAQYDLIWPQDLPPWSEKEEAEVKAALDDWKKTIPETWSDKFDLRREGCASSNPACCRYTVKVTADFEPITVAKMNHHSIILAPDLGRPNSFAWTVEGTVPNTAPHEFGHHLGCPDEYRGSSVDKTITDDIPNPSQPGVDETSLMGSMSKTDIAPVKARHFDLIRQHLTNMLKAQKGVTLVFKAVPHR